jgi:hypothetical protein
MPWTPNEAERHTRKATTRELQELWAKVANEALERTGDEGSAIREANAVIARQAAAAELRDAEDVSATARPNRCRAQCPPPKASDPAP